MKRFGGWLFFILLMVGWIVFSYRPDWMPLRAELSDAMAPLFRTLIIAAGVLFVAIHLYLIGAVRRYRTAEPGPDGERPIRLHRGAEYFWSIVPLLGTLVLFWAGLQSLPDR